MPDSDSAVNETERAIFGMHDAADITRLLDDYLADHVGTSIDEVLFRAGRIDAVWAVHTTDGRDFAVKGVPAARRPRRPRGHDPGAAPARRRGISLPDTGRRSGSAGHRGVEPKPC